MGNLCQGCVMLQAEKDLHLPHEHSGIKKDLRVCVSCYSRITNAIKQNETFTASLVGNKILGLKSEGN